MKKSGRFRWIYGEVTASNPPLRVLEPARNVYPNKLPETYTMPHSPTSWPHQEILIRKEAVKAILPLSPIELLGDTGRSRGVEFDE
jgi:hypothetical protein